MTITRTNAAEEEYFRRQEAEQRREDAWDTLQRAARTNQAERDRLKAAHLRPCPECKIGLEKRTLRGIEIDQCSSCHGMWLEAGELEQLSKKKPGFMSKLISTWRGGVDT